MEVCVLMRVQVVGAHLTRCGDERLIKCLDGEWAIELLVV